MMTISPLSLSPSLCSPPKPVRQPRNRERFGSTSPKKFVLGNQNTYFQVLQDAVLKDDAVLVERMAALKKIDLNRPFLTGEHADQTALTLAAAKKRLATFRVLAAHPDVNINYGLSEREVPNWIDFEAEPIPEKPKLKLPMPAINHAMEHPTDEYLDPILARPDAVMDSWTGMYPADGPPLNRALMRHQKERFFKILKHPKLDVNMTSGSCAGYTPLMMAFEDLSDADMLQGLLDKPGIDLHHMSERDRSALGVLIFPYYEPMRGAEKRYKFETLKDYVQRVTTHPNFDVQKGQASLEPIVRDDGYFHSDKVYEMRAKLLDWLFGADSRFKVTNTMLEQCRDSRLLSVLIRHAKTS